MKMGLHSSTALVLELRPKASLPPSRFGNRDRLCSLRWSQREAGHHSRTAARGATPDGYGPQSQTSALLRPGFHQPELRKSILLVVAVMQVGVFVGDFEQKN